MRSWSGAHSPGPAVDLSTPARDPARVAVCGSHLSPDLRTESGTILVRWPDERALRSAPAGAIDFSLVSSCCVWLAPEGCVSFIRALWRPAARISATLRFRSSACRSGELGGKPHRRRAASSRACKRLISQLVTGGPKRASRRCRRLAIVLILPSPRRTSRLLGGAGAVLPKTWHPCRLTWPPGQSSAAIVR